MTERKIVLYLEQKTISEKYQKAFSRMSENKNSSFRIADYYFFNSLGKELVHVLEKLDIPREILIDLRKKSIDKIAVVRWDMIRPHLCRIPATEKIDIVFFRETLKSFEDSGIPLIFNIDNKDLLDRVRDRYKEVIDVKLLVFRDDILIVANKCLTPNPLKYRLYLNDRLLIERYYPIDIEHNRMIAEIVHLNDKASGEVKVESNFDLQIKRVEVDGQKQDIYSSSFLLP